MKIEDYIQQEYGVISILGMRGCGKTYLASNLEFRKELKVLYIDVVGAFRQKMPDKYYVIIDRLPSYDEMVELFDVFDERREVILDISELKREDMVQVCDYVWDCLKKSDQKWALVIDEISEICPQDRVFYSQGIESCVRMGRNKGVLFMVMTNQRMQKVNKDLINLSDCYVIFKFIAKLDQEGVRGTLGWDAQQFYPIGRDLKSLKVGEYMITDGIDYTWKRKEIPKEVISEEMKSEEKIETVSTKPLNVKDLPPPKKVWTEEKLNKLRELRKANYSYEECGKILGCSGKVCSTIAHRKGICKPRRLKNAKDE